MPGGYKICRVCEASENLKEIFRMGTSDLAVKLMSCADVQVEIDDKLPQYICLKCSEHLDLTYEFRIKCESTDRKLRKLLLNKQESQESLSFTDLDKCSYSDDKKSAESDRVPAEFGLESFDDVEELIEVEKLEVISDEEEEESMGRAYFLEDIDESRDADIENSFQAKFEKEFINPPSNEAEEDYLNDEFCDEEKQQSDMSDIFADEANELEENKKEEKESPADSKDKTESNISGKIFNCETCGETMKSFTELNKHKKSHGDKCYQCPTCKKWFSKKYRLKNHMLTHDGSKSYSCEICGNKYTNQGNMYRHIRHFHKKERPYMCNECGLSFSRSNILKLHLTVHISERNFECDICRKRFKAEYYLKLHKKSHIPLEQRRPNIRKPKPGVKTSYACSYCGKISATKSLQVSHMRIHTGEKPFECSTCHRKFAFRQTLKSHELLHTGEKPYICVLCGLAFRQQGHLNGHMLVHSGLKNHKCQYCEKTFALKSNLVVHQRLHTGETPYHCNSCDKKFYDSNGLKRHIKTHLKKQTAISEQKEEEVRIEPVTEFFEENNKQYNEIIEMEINENIKVINLNDHEPC